MSNNKDQINMADLAASLPDAAAALSAEDRADLVNALKNKLQTFAGKHSDVLGTLSPNIRKRVDVLREIQVIPSDCGSIAQLRPSMRSIVFALMMLSSSTKD